MKLIYKIISLILVSLMISCGASKEAKVDAEQMAAAPKWVAQRPITNMFYVGIARIEKANYPQNFRESAKKMALNDLASEISVTIESSSIVSSYENNSGFESEYSRYIEMEMRNELQGHTMVGEYETDKMYMVYYHLSKQKWRAIQAEKKKAASDRSFSLFTQAQKQINNLEYKSAVKSLTNSILELKKYWNEPVYHMIDNQKQRLDIVIKEELSTILSEMKLVAIPKNISLNNKNNFTQSLSLKVVNSKGKLLKGIPIKVSYRKANLPFQTTIYSENNIYKLPLEQVKFSNKTTYVNVQLEKSKIIKINTEDRKMLAFISDAFQDNPVNIAVDYKLPNIYIDTKSKSKNFHFIKDAVSQSIGNKGFKVVGSSANADLIMKLKTFENTPMSTSKVKSAYVTYSAILLNIDNDEIIYTFSSENIKGVDYTDSGAIEKSYKKLSEEIKESSFESLLQSIIY